MNKKLISGLLAGVLVAGNVNLSQCPITVQAEETVGTSNENTTAIKFDETVIDAKYQGTSFESRQIPCETLGGIYCLNHYKLMFYSMDTGVSSNVYTFEDVADSFVANGKLYVLGEIHYNEKGAYSFIVVYDLEAQKLDRTIEFYQKSSAIGVDDTGRIYLAGPSENGFTIYLLSSQGELLSQTTSKQEIYEFCGFDSTNGNFYVESSDTMVSWGYEHAMHALRAGNVTENTIVFSETILQYVSQHYFNERPDQVQLLGNKYLCVDSSYQPGLYIWDSNSYSATAGNVPSMTYLKREAGKWHSCEGVRAVFQKASDSVIAYKDDSTLAEYDIKTGQELTSVSTAYPVFSLMEYKNGILAIEKKDNTFYYEYFSWTRATTIQLTGSTSDIKVGETLPLTVVTDGTLKEHLTWTSSDPTIASVNPSGEIFAWHKGTVTISVKNHAGLTATYTINVSENPNLQNATNPVVQTSGSNTENASANQYTVWSSPVGSYLMENPDKTLTRVEYLNNQIQIEQYSSDGTRLENSKTLPAELSLFGGFFSGTEGNYFVFGNPNPSQDNTVEVLRIVKYSKEWNRISSVSVNGANTYIPFDAGSLRMTETDGKLYIHTCHEMYDHGDGLHHQANMTFVVNESTLSIEQSYYDVMNIAQAGYVSHSFNQFVQTDGKHIYRVDHGDANPRAVSITKCDKDGKITRVSYCLPIDLSNVSGYNQTGISVGGFALSSNNCMIAGNGVDFTKSQISDTGIRNIFLSVTDKELEQTNLVWLTNYSDAETGDADSACKVKKTRTPHLIKIGNDSFLFMWEEVNTDDDVYTKLVTVDGNGTITSKQVATNMRLSDCQPILCSDGMVRWYAGEKTAPVLYTVNPFDLDAAHVHIFDKGTITKQATISSKGEMLYTCKYCGETKTEQIDEIQSKNLETAVVHGISNKTYTGKEVEQNIFVTWEDTPLEEDTDYTIRYKNNKKVGKAQIIIEGAGEYTGSLSKDFYIKPKAVTLTSVKSPKKSQLKVTWKKDSQASGYRIIYATNRKFTKQVAYLTVSASKNTKKMKRLTKGKRYYIKIQAYKTVDRKKIYGSCSAIKAITVKDK